MPATYLCGRLRALSQFAFVLTLGGCAIDAGALAPPQAPAGQATTPEPTAHAPHRPSFPGIARSNTTAGALSFARFYLASVGFAWAKPDPAVLKGLTMDGCEACDNYAGEAARLMRTHERFGSAPLSVGAARLSSAGPAGLEVDVAVEQLAARSYHLDGSLARRQEAQSLTMAVVVDWQQGGWRIRSIRKL